MMVQIGFVLPLVIVSLSWSSTLIGCSAAFIPMKQQSRQTLHGLASRMAPRDDDSLEEFQAKRQEFEKLLLLHLGVEPSTTTTSSSSSSPSSSLLTSSLAEFVPAGPSDYIPPPITESFQRRRELEIQLLESLQDSDDAIDALMNLWMVERTVESAQQLQSMQETCSSGLVEEERQLRAMIQEYDIHWVEPLCRLALVLYYKGEIEEAICWNWIAFCVKPWHFEVAHLMTLLQLREGNFAEAITFRRKYGLPSLNERTNHQQRRRWVQRALEYAHQDTLKRHQASMRRQLQQQRQQQLQRGQEDECPIGAQCWQ